jgi:hypothetical protein
MKVSELIERLSEYDGDLEVQFGIWDQETGQVKDAFPISEVNHYDPIDPVLYIWNE